PKIAPYPFTTKIPNLGVLHVDAESDLIIADIPGIIEGASQGAGLGIRFIKHISRTACLLFMIDCSAPNYKTAYSQLLKELNDFSEDLLQKPRIVLCNKIDLEGAMDHALELIEIIHEEEKDTKVIPVSVAARQNIDEARDEIISLVSQMERLKSPGKNHASSGDVPVKSSFMAERSVDDSMEEQFPGSEA
ncbi:MAG: 50S ribosome-binding GTPase, partial [Treponema sp.]|nr:50S ribosome-binding GTPase [Treponema sp.]